MLRILKSLIGRLLGLNSETQVFTDASTSRELNYETDSIRFIYEGLLREYEIVRSELELHIELTDRAINYLLIVVVAVFSAQELLSRASSPILDIGANNPIVYLALGLLLLYFPISILSHHLQIANLGSYQYHVLTPKINQISSHLRSLSHETKAFLDWEAEHWRSQPWLRGNLRWDAYRLSRQMRGAAPLFGLLEVTRYLFAFAPSIYLAATFLTATSGRTVWKDWTLVERSLAFMYLLVLIGAVAGLATLIDAHLRATPRN
jgi:hypothetical protein